MEVFLSSLRMQELLVRLQELAGIRLSSQAMEELADDANTSLKLVDPDIESIDVTVKYMNLIEHSAGVVLAHDAVLCTGRASDRLFSMADGKFRRSLERTPNSSLTLFDWGKMLHLQAQRCVESLRPVEDGVEESVSQLALRLSLQRSKASADAGKTQDPKLVRASSASGKLHKRHGSYGLRRAASLRPTESSSPAQVLDIDILQQKARSCFASGEDKLRRALRIKTEYAEASLELAHLLYDYGMFLVSLAVTSSNEHVAIRLFAIMTRAYSFLRRNSKYSFSDLGREKLTESLSIDPCRLSSVKQRAFDSSAEFSAATDFASLRDYFVEASPLLQAISGNRQEDGLAHFDAAMMCAKYCAGLVNRLVEPEIMDKYIAMATECFLLAIQADPKFIKSVERFLQLEGKPADFLVFSQIGTTVGPLNDVLKMRCQHVSTINLPHCNGLKETGIQSLLVACSNLRVLGLEGNSKSVTDDTMRFVATNCPALEALTVKDCKNLTTPPVLDSQAINDSLMAALNSASFLGLGVGGGAGITPAVLGSNQRNIGASLASSQNSKLKGESAVNLTSSCSDTLKVCSRRIHSVAFAIPHGFSQFLDISGCPLIESRHIAALIVYSKLETLLMSGANKLVDADFVRLVEHSRQLQTIAISDCFQLSSVAFSSLSKLERLVSLSVGSCKSLTDEGLAGALKAAASLQSLDISYNRALTDATLKVVAAIKGNTLKSIVVAGCEAISDAGLKGALKRAGLSLQTLDASNCPLLTDVVGGYIAKYCGHVLELSLAFNPKLTSKTVECLSRSCSRLEKLDVSGCNNIEAGLTALLGSCPLDQLKAASCSFSSQDVALAFSGNTEARKSGAALKMLDLSDIRVTDEALGRVVASATQLRVLKLSQCGSLTNAAMAKLSQLCNLTELYADNVYYLTDAGVEALFDPAGSVGRTIRVLSLQKCAKLTDSSMITISEFGRGIKRLLISKWRLQTQSVRLLLQSCIDMEDLLLEHCAELSVSDTKAMIRSEFQRVTALVL